MKYRVNNPNGDGFDIRIENNQLFLNEQEIHLDLSETSVNKYNIIDNNKSYNLEIIKVDITGKHFTIKVNDEIFELDLKDQLDMQLEEMGMSKNEEDRIDNILAPMPGLVLKIIAKEGQEVEKGDSLLILEAMKMENVIKSPGSGIVKEIKVKEQDAIEKNHILIVME